MKITNAIYTNEDNSSLKATLDDGTDWHMPQPCNTWHNTHLQEFIDEGGVIEPYEAPMEVQSVSMEDTLAAIMKRLDALENK